MILLKLTLILHTQMYMYILQWNTTYIIYYLEKSYLNTAYLYFY